jgi:hypothetical protein
MAGYDFPSGADGTEYANTTLGHAARMAEDPKIKGLLMQMASRVKPVRAPLQHVHPGHADRTIRTA